MARILAQMGLRADGEVAPRLAAEPWYLWPCNVPTWRLWMRLQTQWRHAGIDGQRTGLDYAGVWAAMQALRVRKPREVFDHLQHMERAALQAWAELRERKRPGPELPVDRR